jgi:hypothetical protein
MALTICPPLKLSVWAVNPITGVLEPLIGGKVYTYIAGTVTPQDTFNNANGTSPNLNPIILDARGEANCFLSATAYDFAVYDADDNFVQDQFNIVGTSTSTLGFVGTIDELENLPIGTADIFFVAGYNTADDTCNSQWYWDSASTLTPDKVFVAIPVSIPASGRYIRQYQGQKVTPKFAGVLGNGLTQDWTLFNASILNSFPDGLDFYLPGGEWLVDANLGFPLSCIEMDGGATFSINTGIVLTITKRIIKDRTSAFTGLGTVNLSSMIDCPAFPEWFGAVGDGSTNDYAAFNKLFAANPNRVEFSAIYGAEGAALAFGSSLKEIDAKGFGFNVGASGLVISSTAGAQGMVIRNLYVSTAQSFITFNGDGIVFESPYFEGEVLTATSAIRVNSPSSFTNATFDYFSVASPNDANSIFLLNGHDVIFTGCRFLDTTVSIDYGIIADINSIVIINNTSLSGLFVVAFLFGINGGQTIEDSTLLNGILTIPGSLTVGVDLTVVANLSVGSVVTSPLTVNALVKAYYGATSDLMAMGGVIQSTNTPVVITVDGNLMAATIPGFTLVTDSDFVVIHTFGSLLFASSGGRDIRLKHGATLIETIISGAGASLFWAASHVFVRTSSSTGTIYRLGSAGQITDGDGFKNLTGLDYTNLAGIVFQYSGVGISSGGNNFTQSNLNMILHPAAI